MLLSRREKKKMSRRTLEALLDMRIKFPGRTDEEAEMILESVSKWRYHLDFYLFFVGSIDVGCSPFVLFSFRPIQVSAVCMQFIWVHCLLNQSRARSDAMTVAAKWRETRPNARFSWVKRACCTCDMHLSTFLSRPLKINNFYWTHLNTTGA